MDWASAQEQSNNTSISQWSRDASRPGMLYIYIDADIIDEG
jgi:hypothetical protein